jgi:hypothetical protein
MVARIAEYSSSFLTRVLLDAGLLTRPENYHKIRTAVVPVLNADKRGIVGRNVNRITTF